MGRKLQAPRAPLPEALEHMIANLFANIDLDGGGSLNASELSEVMAACSLPADRDSVLELITMMDTDGDMNVSVKEFEWWMREQISRGKPIDEGTFELPSGQVLLLPLPALLFSEARQLCSLRPQFTSPAPCRQLSIVPREHRPKGACPNAAPDRRYAGRSRLPRAPVRLLLLIRAICSSKCCLLALCAQAGASVRAP